MIKKIIHQISLTGIGGVQQSFLPYFKVALSRSKFKHVIFGLHKIDKEYDSIESYYTNLTQNYFKLFYFVYQVFSKQTIIHFYNNLGSKQVYRLLNIIPSTNIIFHERGTIWNANMKDQKNYVQNALRAKIILANSNATKIMLSEKFGIDESKIYVLYNGFLSSSSKYLPKNNVRYSETFSVGYIGRLDTPKGVHILIKAATYLKEYNFYIAGDGAWKDLLIQQAEGYSNIYFLGRVSDPLEFIEQMDIIVVPSIREPLGNTVIEAGFCKKAVIASNVDGIPEIVENKISGILLNPKNNLSIKKLPLNAVPIPDVVVDPISKSLVSAKEIDAHELCESIKFLETNNETRLAYGNELHKKVLNTFSIENYFDKLESIYKGLDNGNK